MVRAACGFAANQAAVGDANTIVGDKMVGAAAGKQVDSDGWPVDDSWHEIVLRSSAQCLPMIKFDKALRQHQEGKECVRFMKKSLQKILDRLFNKGLQRSDFRSATLINKPPKFPSARAPNPPGVPLPPPPRNPFIPPTFAPPPAMFPSVPAGAPPPGLSAAIQSALGALGGGGGLAHPGLSAALAGAPPAAIQSALGATSAFLGGGAAPIPSSIAVPNFGGAATVPNPSVPTRGRTKQTARGGPRKLLATKVARASGRSGANAYTNPSSTIQTLTFKAPRSLSAGVPSNALIAPPASFNKKDMCVICHDPFKRSSRCVALNACSHIFHKECVELAFKSKPQCPVCRVPVGEPQGKCPSGTMAVSNSAARCSGYHEDSILISYNIPSGTQMSYHDNPGRRHGGKIATAYLPNNADGQALLKRLKYSFLHGLSFAVGTSMTTGMADQCTW